MSFIFLESNKIFLTGISFIKHLLKANPEKRFSIDEALNHHWLGSPKPNLLLNIKGIPFKVLKDSPSGKAIFLEPNFFQFKTSKTPNKEKKDFTNSIMNSSVMPNNERKINSLFGPSNSPPKKTNTRNQNQIFNDIKRFSSPKTEYRKFSPMKKNKLSNENNDSGDENKDYFDENTKQTNGNLINENDNKNVFYKKKNSSILVVNQRFDLESDNKILKNFPNMRSIDSTGSINGFDLNKKDKPPIHPKNDLISANVLNKAIERKRQKSQMSPDFEKDIKVNPTGNEKEEKMDNLQNKNYK